MGARNKAHQGSDAEGQRRKESERLRFIETTRPRVSVALRQWCGQMGITDIPEVAVRNLGCTLEGGVRRTKYRIHFTVNGLKFRGHVSFLDDRCSYKVRLIWPNGAKGPAVTSETELSSALARAGGRN